MDWFWKDLICYESDIQYEIDWLVKGIVELLIACTHPYKWPDNRSIGGILPKATLKKANMNKIVLLVFAALAILGKPSLIFCKFTITRIFLNIVIAESKQIRPKFTMENICRDDSCADKCLTNGYDSGHCKPGDLVVFCICGDCAADKCGTSCLKDQLKGSCESANNGNCVCN